MRRLGTDLGAFHSICLYSHLLKTNNKTSQDGLVLNTLINAICGVYEAEESDESDLGPAPEIEKEPSTLMQKPISFTESMTQKLAQNLQSMV